MTHADVRCQLFFANTYGHVDNIGQRQQCKYVYVNTAMYIIHGYDCHEWGMCVLELIVGCNMWRSLINVAHVMKPYRDYDQHGP